MFDLNGGLIGFFIGREWAENLLGQVPYTLPWTKSELHETPATQEPPDYQHRARQGYSPAPLWRVGGWCCWGWCLRVGQLPSAPPRPCPPRRSSYRTAPPGRSVRPPPASGFLVSTGTLHVLVGVVRLWAGLFATWLAWWVSLVGFLYLVGSGLGMWMFYVVSSLCLFLQVNLLVFED